METKLSPEQQGLVDYLKARNGKVPKTIRGLFSLSTIDSLINRAIIFDSWQDGTYRLAREYKVGTEEAKK